MFTHTSVGEDMKGTEDDSFNINLDLDIGKLSISPIPYQSSCVAADISSLSLVEPDVSSAYIGSAFDSDRGHESLEQRDGVVLDAKDDNYNSVGLAYLRRQFSGDEHVITNFDSGVLVDVAEQSAQGDCEAKDLVGTDETCMPSHSLIVYTSSRRRSARNTKSGQKNGFSKPSNSRVVANECSEFDLSSLQVLKRSRSSFAKRARSSVWGDLGNILQDIDKSSRFDQSLGKERKQRSVKGGKGKRKGIKDQAGKKSRGKTVVPTGHISLKIKIGNKFCIPGNTFENFSTSDKNVSELLDTKEKMLGEEVSRDVVSGGKTNLDKVMSSNGSALSTHLQVRDTCYNQPDTSSNIRRLDEGDDSLIGLTEIRCSDVGTSPDSEIINSIPDVPLCEKGLPDLQDGTIVSRVMVSKTDISHLISSPKPLKKGKKKVKIPQVDNCQLGSKLTGAGTRNNASTPADMKDVSSLSASRTKSKKGMKKDKLCDLGNYLETNRKGTSSTNKANGPADLGVGGICYQSDANMRTEKPYLNAADTKLPSGFVDTNIVSNSRLSHTMVPCTNDREFLKCSTSKGGRFRDFPNEKETASRLKGIEKDFNGKETPSNLGGIGLLCNGAAEPINRMQFSSDGVKNQYDPLWNAWVLCDECQKWRRILATLADQIEETDCGWTCRDNTDKNFADCSIPQEKSNSEINDELEISEGSYEDDAYGAFLKHNEDRSNDAQQSSWTLIKSNLFLQRSRKTQTIDDVMVCHCKPPSDGRMGCGAECLNRILNIECVQGTCPCGEFCSNQQFQKRKYAKLKWFRCGKKGYGLQALEDIPQGQFLIEYVGEVLDVHAYKARQREYSMKGHKHFYFMTLNGSEVIDACAKGNLGRFINHSCDPNCRTEKWMVNGEICIGLFSLRGIKKGEEVTFDYNFVRVFGAAAKRCVCGSANCRGYIGGDLTNSEVIAQDDSDIEFAEPVMTCEDGEMNEDWNDIMLNNSNDQEDEIVKEPSQNKIIGSVAESILTLQTTEPSPKKIGVNSGHVAEIRVGDGIGICDSIDNISAADVGKLNNNRTSDESLRGSTPAGPKVECEGTLSQMHDSNQVMGITLQSDGIVNTSISSAQETVISVAHNKTLSSKVKCKRNLKHASVEGRVELAKSKSLTKTNRPLFSIKKSKPKVNALKDKASPDVDKLSAEQHKSKKLPKLPVDHHFEAVEEKLNELLDPEGGISKRKDASKGYLKLLFLTAATGNNGDGEAIQSNRDLSMILDALLKTKSRTVLVDIINKNGLQMLHNIMKRYRKEFIKTPILRKLLKVLEYLATREILTLEHITGGPPCLGIESFKDSILSLAEHVDKQVHQIARNFRDKWIPRSLRNYCFVERDECHQPSSHGGSSLSYDQWSDKGGKPSETTNSIETGSVSASGTAETSTVELSALGTSKGINEPKTRKRKSRWDNPAEHTNSIIRNNSVGDEDIPPGFSHPSQACSTATNHQERQMPGKLHSNIVSGNPQSRFFARLPVSYGIPNSVMQHFRDPQAEIYEGWNIAPGLPFLPFPPLPPSTPVEIDRSTSSRYVSSSAPIDTCPTHQTERQNKRSCSMNSPEKNSSVVNSLPQFQQGGSCSLGRKYFRQQKWNPPKLPPWVRMRTSWGVSGNNTRSGSPGVGLANEPNDYWNSCNWEENHR